MRSCPWRRSRRRAPSARLISATQSGRIRRNPLPWPRVSSPIPVVQDRRLTHGGPFSKLRLVERHPVLNQFARHRGCGPPQAAPKKMQGRLRACTVQFEAMNALVKIEQMAAQSPWTSRSARRRFTSRSRGVGKTTPDKKAVWLDVDGGHSAQSLACLLKRNWKKIDVRRGRSISGNDRSNANAPDQHRRRELRCGGASIEIGVNWDYVVGHVERAHVERFLSTRHGRS